MTQIYFLTFLEAGSSRLAVGRFGFSSGCRWPLSLHVSSHGLSSVCVNPGVSSSSDNDTNPIGLGLHLYDLI